MKRLNIYITESQDIWVRQVAVILDVPIADVVRNSLRVAMAHFDVESADQQELFSEPIEATILRLDRRMSTLTELARQAGIDVGQAPGSTEG